jgi:hypothetical protein
MVSKHTRPFTANVGIAQLERFSPYVRNIKQPNYTYMPLRKRLRHLIDREQLDEAMQLFQQLVKTDRFKLELVWQVGAEIIGKLFPGRIREYLKTVYISSSEQQVMKWKKKKKQYVFMPTLLLLLFSRWLLSIPI